MDYRSKTKTTKQKKQPKSCPNPLFLKWLEQWRDEAKSKESKLQYVYSKAISSLKKYPLPLESGKEAMLLEGVGPSIAKKLDEELLKHRSNLVEDDLSGWKEKENSIDKDNFSDLRIPPPSSLIMSTVTSPSDYSSPLEDIGEPKSKKKRKTSPHKYIPSYRSGPYAMIMALYNASERSGYKGYLTKAEIQQQAQSFTETSFTMPEPDSYYTAWSSMSTLIKKGIVSKAGNPARFHLTDSGHVLTKKLLTATADQNTTLRSPSSQVSPVYRINGSSLSLSPTSSSSCTTTLNKEKYIPAKTTTNSKHAVTKPHTNTRPEPLPETNNAASTSSSRCPKDYLASYRKKISGTEVKQNKSGSLSYWFIDSDGQCVQKEDQALVTIDEEISLGFLIKCKLCELEKAAGLKYKLDHSRPSKDGYVFAYLASDCITEANMTTNTACPSDDSDDDEMFMQPLFQRITKDPDICITNISTNMNKERKESIQTSKKTCAPVISKQISVAEKVSIQPTPSDIEITESNSGAKLAQRNQPRRNIVPAYELKPGCFEIILCVDFVEITGGSKTVRKEEMVKELRRNGVQFDVRKLNVGDFLWIAQEKMTPIPGQLVLPTQRELVLDYIVERKRMDDLCSSIKDGRFKEQKFRLLNSGLRHPVYLVEDFGSANFLSMPAQTLEQAIINTQIGQDFFVKRTQDIKESAAYLTLMTRHLQTAYDNKTLKAIKREDVELVEVDENEFSTFLMTYQELSDISLKNKILTVSEVFGKQLLQIPGVAIEKVISISESYPTLRHLLDTYEEQTSEEEKQNLLAGLKFGKNQRKIGPSLSKLIYQLYCTRGALT